MSDTCDNCGAPLSIGQGSAEVEIDSLKETIEQLRAHDAARALEAWVSEEKCRSATIAIDDGYGATCWRVELRRGRSTVLCSETNFVAREAVDPMWHEQDGCLYCCVIDGDSERFDWPGLSATIRHAIACARKFWGAKGGDDE